MAQVFLPVEESRNYFVLFYKWTELNGSLDRTLDRFTILHLRYTNTQVKKIG